MAKQMIDIKRIDRESKNILEDLGERVKKRLLEPTSTWSRPVKSRVVPPRIHSGDLICDIEIEDDRYYWLNEGTSVRRAVMPFPFYPKTKPGSFAAGGGKAHVRPVLSGKKAPKLPGIQAREWTPMAADEFADDLQDVCDRIAAMTGEKITPADIAPWAVYVPD